MSLFVGNFKASRDLEAWLQRTDFPPNLTPASVLFLVGPTGVGKTHGVRSGCERLGLHLQMIDTGEVSTFKEFYDMFQKMAVSDITVQLTNKSKQSIVFCIDELEAFVTIDRTFISSFQKILQQGNLPHVKIIVTAQLIVQRKMQDMHLKGTKIEMGAPDDSEMFAFLKSVAPKGTPVKGLLQIAETCNGNLSYALHTLKLLSVPKQAHRGRPSKKKKGTEAVAPDEVPHDIAATDRAWSITDVFLRPDSTNIHRLFVEDPWLYPLRFHENMSHDLKQRSGGIGARRAAYCALLRTLCEWDVMMSHYRGDNFAIPLEFLGRGITWHLSGVPRKKGAQPPRDEFTKIFSYLSLCKKNQQLLQAAISDNHELDGLHSFHVQLLSKSANNKNISTK